MEVTRRINYDITRSAERMDAILDADYSKSSYLDHIPSHNDLAYNSGYHVNITALFIDIVGSSNLTSFHKSPVLAKIYNCFISESIAIMLSNALCKEISINGDCVWGVFDTSLNKDKINTVFNDALQLQSMINILNDKIYKRYRHLIEVGIGVDCGHALMVKAGYSGSGLNDMIWMGKVVNTACHLANKAGRNGMSTILVSENVFSKLNTSSIHSEWFDLELGNYYEW